MFKRVFLPFDTSGILEGIILGDSGRVIGADGKWKQAPEMSWRNRWILLFVNEWIK